MAEVDGVLADSFQKRMGRIEQRTQCMTNVTTKGTTNGTMNGTTNGTANGTMNGTANGTTQGPAPGQTAEVQTESCSFASMELVETALKKAYRKAAACSRPRTRFDFGASKAQKDLTDPPEKKEDRVAESTTLRQSQQTLQQQLASRQKQIRNLQAQVVRCQEISEQTHEDLSTSQRKLEDMQGKTTSLPTAHAECLKQRRERVANLKTDLDSAGKDFKHYKALVQQQHQYQMQSDFFSVPGRQQAISSHPAGEIFLASQPASVTDETSEAWDVGTAIANPYVCDSWPFEANVLAQRTFGQNPELQPWREETEMDIDVEEVFPELDTNHDGEISIEDAAAYGLTLEEFKAIDLDDDDVITREELLYAACKDRGEPLPKRMARP